MSDLAIKYFFDDCGIELDWILKQLAPNEVSIFDDEMPALKWREQISKESDAYAIVKKDERAISLLVYRHKTGLSSLEFTVGKPQNAKFDCDGCWGWYENGVEKKYAHGHEEGDTHDRNINWYEWVDEKLKCILT